MSAQVVVPRWMFGGPVVRRDEDDVVAVGEVRERSFPTFATASTDRRQYDIGIPLMPSPMARCFINLIPIRAMRRSPYRSQEIRRVLAPSLVLVVLRHRVEVAHRLHGPDDPSTWGKQGSCPVTHRPSKYEPPGPVLFGVFPALVKHARPSMPRRRTYRHAHPC